MSWTNRFKHWLTGGGGGSGPLPGPPLPIPIPAPTPTPRPILPTGYTLVPGDCGDCCDTPCTCYPCPHCRFNLFPCDWDYAAEGFSGDCAIFNGHYRLRMYNPCAWRYVGTDFTITLVVMLDGRGEVTLVRGSITVVYRTVSQFLCCGDQEPVVVEPVSGCPTYPALVYLVPYACTCQDTPPPTGCCSCETVTSLAREWTFTMPALGSGPFCPNGTNWGGREFILRWHSQCQWQDWRPEVTECDNYPEHEACKTFTTWHLTGSSPASYKLYPSFLDFRAAQYEKLLPGWDCNGPNVMVRNGPANNDYFTGLPDTVTLTPSTKRIPVCACIPPFDVVSTRYKFRIEGPDVGCGLDQWQILDPVIPAFGLCSWEKDYSPMEYLAQLHFPSSFARVTEIRGWGKALLTLGRGGYYNKVFYLPMAIFDPMGDNVLLPGPFGSCGYPNDGPQCVQAGSMDIFARVQPA